MTQDTSGGVGLLDPLVPCQRPLPACIVLSVLCGVAFTSNVMISLVGPFLPQHFASIGISQIWSGIMFSGFPIAMLICSPVAVSGMKRFGRPLVLMVGLIIQGIGSVMFGFADQMTGGPGVNTSAALVVYSLSRFACGAGGACANNAIFSIAADRFPDTLGRVMSLNEVVIGVGFSLGPPIGSVLYLSGGFGLPFIVAGFAVLVFTPFAAMLWQPAPQIVPEYNFQGQEYGMMEVLKLKLVVPAISLLLGTAVFGIVNSTMSLYLQYEVGVPVQAIGAIFAALSAAYALGGAIMGGPVMDCFGALRVCTAGGFFSGLVLVVLLGPAAHFLHAGTTPRIAYEVVALLALGGAQAATIIPSLPAMKEGAGISGPSATECIVAWFNVFLQLGLAVGPIVGTYLVGVLGFEYAVASCGAVIAMYGVASFSFALSTPVPLKKLRGHSRSTISPGVSVAFVAREPAEYS